MQPLQLKSITDKRPTDLPPSLQQRTPANIFKVAVLGVESTGKTTLCKDLAQHFSTTWVPEYMRIYLQDKWHQKQTSCEWVDLMPIAQGQVATENKQATQADRYLFCDTSLFELMIYAKWYYGRCPVNIERAALSHHYDLVLLTEVDVLWQPDDLRDAPGQRQEIDTVLAQALQSYNKPYRRIGGDRQARVHTVANWLKGSRR